MEPLHPTRLRDALERPLTDLRLSVTDRCNFRCRYCMPRESIHAGSFLARSELLSYEELAKVAQVFVGLGVSKLRLTGGEPLLRKNLAAFVEQLSSLPVDLALTTNGALLPAQAQKLKRAGLGRLTISLDALNEKTFQEMADAPQQRATATLKGIQAAQEAGFRQIKINCVVRRGINEDQVLPLLRHFAGSGHCLRFIEYMAVGTRNEWQMEEVLSAAALREMIGQHYPLQTLPKNHPSETAQRYFIPQLNLEIGLIASVTESFCQSCSRARLSSDGQLFDCLFASRGLDLKTPLRQGATENELALLIAQFWSKRDARFSAELENTRDSPLIAAERLISQRRIEMSYIGG